MIIIIIMKIHTIVCSLALSLTCHTFVEAFSAYTSYTYPSMLSLLASALWLIIMGGHGFDSRLQFHCSWTLSW